MSDIVMELANVNKTIGKKHIIKDLSFTIKRGEVFGFIGPNGAGKTTTIRMMVGLMGISSGDILISGQSIKTNFKQAVNKVGAIVENPEMYPFMTGMQNLKHFARMTGGVGAERIKEIIELVRLDQAINEKVGRYSLGMRQRLGIAQALLHRPEVLILDEPTNGLDPSGMREIRQYIRKIAVEDNVAVIISSHLLSEIELMCDRIGIIKNGELIAIEDIHNDDTSPADVQILHQVKIEVTEARQAIAILKEAFNLDAALDNGHVLLHTEKETIPKIIKTLTINNHAIYGVNVRRASLEDKFLDLIGENVIG